MVQYSINNVTGQLGSCAYILVEYLLRFFVLFCHDLPKSFLILLQSTPLCDLTGFTLLGGCLTP